MPAVDSEAYIGGGGMEVFSGSRWETWGKRERENRPPPASSPLHQNELRYSKPSTEDNELFFTVYKLL